MEPARSTPSLPSRHRLLTIAAVSTGVLLACIAIGTILGDLPEPLWLLLVPIGMLGSVITGITSLALALIPRQRG